MAAVRTVVHGAQCTALPSHPVTAAAYLVDGAATYGMGGERAYAPVALARRVEAIGYHHRTTGRCAPAPPAPCAGAVAPSPLGPLSRVT
ncbi:hypothetical protein [Rhodococcus koreensis]|uniref:hypothetical protein n=1 Tax=Rhodococcus koreensis TaxID=99653 RepID=UPI0036718ACA